jgi:hypothetical protein
MPVDSVERCDLLAGTPTRAPGPQTLRVRGCFNNSVEAPSNRYRVKSSTRLLTLLVCRSYAEEAAANRQHLGMSSRAGDAVGCHRFFVRRTELSPALGGTDM